MINKYDKDELYKEAAKLGFQQDYDKYSTGEGDFSPLALAEAAASIDLGGFDRYSKITSSDFGSGNTGDPPPVISGDKKTNEDQINDALKDLGDAPNIPQ